ncbi:MAG: methyltransferase domain-containing protein [Methylocella sp.]
MGIDLRGLNFLKFARNKQPLGRVATIGRQNLDVPHHKLKSAIDLRGTKYGPFCEEFLIDHFSAACVDSFDNSDYEQATHIADLNKPLSIAQRYETVIDYGSAEHVYNIPQALKNISELCAPGGQILHSLPANNFCRHGFWQFSPELFFSLYSGANGYCDTQVFLADTANENLWYEVRQPSNGRRAEALSSTPMIALVRTRRGDAFSHEAVQQSDYVYTWRGADQHSARDRQMSSSPAARWKEFVKNSPLNTPFSKGIFLKWLRTPRLSVNNPHLTRLSVSSLVAARRTGAIAAAAPA